MNLLSIPPHQPRRQIELQAVNADHRIVALGRHPPQHSLQSGHELARTERLGHVVIRARGKSAHLGVLITDHNVRDTLKIVDRAYILHEGQVLMEGAPDEIVADADVRRVYLGERFSL